ncbi:MAG: amidohydrolase family protein, partial [Thermoplasmata archaeon]
VVDFREEGLAGTELLRRAARRLPIEVIALGRPLRRPVEPSEPAPIHRLADGTGLSSAREEDRATREAVARACHRAGRRYALHASETTREPADSYLTPRPDLLVHMYGASTDDLDRVARAKIPIAVCPRSNALFGRSPDLARFDRAGVTFFLGTDNAMFAAPSMFREMEFAYTSQRLRRRPVSPARLIRAAFLDPWAWLRRPERARLTEENPAPPIVLRLPEDDPEYQVVARAAEHVMVAPESMGSGSGPG